jgi:hypothetical protein
MGLALHAVRKSAEQRWLTVVMDESQGAPAEYSTLKGLDLVSFAPPNWLHRLRVSHVLRLFIAPSDHL